jgi:hypothetical protein
VRAFSIVCSGLAALLFASELRAQYTVPGTSPVRNAPPAQVETALPPERVDSIFATQAGSRGEVSLARHLLVGAAIGGVAGYLVGHHYPDRGSDYWLGPSYELLGAVAGAATGTLVGAIVWGVRQKPRIDQQPSPYEPTEFQFQRR